MDRDPHDAAEWPQGRDPHRRRIGVLGWALLLLLLLTLFLFGPH